MFIGRGLFPLAALIVGIGLIFNCTKAILRQEDMYDRESTNHQLLANTVGVIIGVCLVFGSCWWFSGGMRMLLGY